MPFTAPSRGFVILYTLAIGGMFVSFMPLVMVLLPLKAALVSQDRVALLSEAALGGAMVASVANIVVGMLSDRTYRQRGTRRPWIAAGLIALVPAYAAFHLSASPVSLLLAVAALQIAINMGFSPILAMMADEVPDSHKGLVGGLIGTGQPIGSLVAVIVVTAPLAEGGRYLLLCAIIVAMVAPFLLLIRERGEPAVTVPEAHPVAQRRLDFARVWAARVLVQVAGNALGTYGFYYFMSVMGETGAKEGATPSGLIATVMAVATVVALAMTVLAGKLSDRAMRRKPFLAAAAVAMAAGLGAMALAQTPALAAGGYILALSSLSVFLGIHSALAMQLLPSPGHRGRDLGILNLTNTLPAIVAPLLALTLAPQQQGFGPLLVTLLLLTLAGGAVVLTVVSED
ncbi:MAG: MFS transporter [Pseudomonadota bacterium]